MSCTASHCDFGTMVSTCFCILVKSALIRDTSSLETIFFICSLRYSSSFSDRSLSSWTLRACSFGIVSRSFFKRSISIVRDFSSSWLESYLAFKTIPSICFCNRLTSASCTFFGTIVSMVLRRSSTRAWIASLGGGGRNQFMLSLVARNKKLPDRIYWRFRWTRPFRRPLLPV